MTEIEALVAVAAFVPFGPARIKLFLEYFGSARKVWNAPLEEFRKIGVGEKLVRELREFRGKFDPSTYFSRLEKFGIKTLTLDDKSYPERLKTINDPPYVLYIKGEILPEDSICVAIVGSRKITSYGRQVAEDLSSELASSGVTIISGLAQGVDAIAHLAALKSGGRTIAVLGNGLDTIYPPSNRGLAKDIISSGALLSEFPVGYPALPANFPYRNRIVSGISLGVVVIEGTSKSGTLLTAAHAASQGREVFAVPGPISSPNSEASHLLIKQGAKLVTSAKDILEELQVEHRTENIVNRKIIPESEEEKVVLEVLETEPLHVDEIVRRLNKDAGYALSILTQMELTGKIRHLGGMIYAIVR